MYTRYNATGHFHTVQNEPLNTFDAAVLKNISIHGRYKICGTSIQQIHKIDCVHIKHISYV